MYRNMRKASTLTYTKAPHNEIILQSNYIFYPDGDMKISVKPVTLIKKNDQNCHKK